VLLKFIKHFVAFTSFILSCVGVYYNNEVSINSINEIEYIENRDNAIDYYAYLRIPEINLSQPLYSKEDSRNDIDSNLIFIDDSDTPLMSNGNVIIAGHSGSSTVSYFKNLYNLDIGDLIYLEYDNDVYKYKIDNKYLVKKTGNIEIIRDTNTKVVTLVTCYGNDKQLVVIANIVGQTKK